jgi:uncharacterized membrane protein YfcA
MVGDNNSVGLTLGMSIILSGVIGSLAGLFGGALGQSGAEFMLPALLILGIVPNFKTAVGTVLIAILPPISILAAIQYYRRGQTRIHISAVLLVCYFFLAYVGARMTKSISNKNLQYATGIYYLIISSFFFWNGYTGRFGQK